MTEKPQRLFISYAHQDKAIVTHVVELLRAGGCEPWSDHLLVAGQHWKRQLHEEIRRCDVFIYILTPKSVTSDWCQWEFYEAVKLGKPVVPIMMKKTALTDALDYIQHVDFTGSAEARSLATAQLIRAVNQAVPTPLSNDIPLNFPEPSGPPEYLRGTTGIHDIQTGISRHTDTSSDREMNPAESTMNIDAGHAAPDRRKRPPLFWWGIIALIAVVIAILIRSGTLVNPPIPQSTVVLTQALTSVIVLPTVIGITDTPIIETPQPQVTVTPAPIVSTATEAAPPPTDDISTVVPDPANESDGSTSTPVPIVAEVKSTSVNLRSGPGINYRTIGDARQGDQFTVIAQANKWFLIELSDGSRGWISSSLVTLSNEGALVPFAVTIPPTPRPIATNTPSQICNPGQWNPVCGSNNCGSEYVSECNPLGTGYTCIWNPQQCKVESGPGAIFKPPRRPTSVPGAPTDIPFVCTNGWLTSQLQAYANQQGITLQQLIQQLLPSYDLDHDGDIDCDDYNAMNGL